MGALLFSSWAQTELVPSKHVHLDTGQRSRRVATMTKIAGDGDSYRVPPLQDRRTDFTCLQKRNSPLPAEEIPFTNGS